MTDDNNSTNETIEGEEVKAQPKKRKKKVVILTECRVLRNFCIKEGEIIRKHNKNANGKYYTHKIELKSGKVRYERTINIVSLDLDDMKAALRLKAVEVI